MKPLQFASLFGSLLIGSTPSFADQSAATITQVSGPIAHASSATAPGQSVGVGSAIRSGEFVKTGKASLAEMVLDNKTVTRVGPSTVLSYSATSHEADLQSGTLLFSKPKDGKEMTFKMSGVTAAITGTTGFVQRDGNNVIVGVIEGTVHVTVGAASTVLQAGKMLVVAGLKGQVVSFDVPDFVGTSAFFSRFQRALPNEKAIEHELADYQDKVVRGFITPVNLAPTPSFHHMAVAAVHPGKTEGATQASMSAVNSTSLASTGGTASANFNLSGANTSTVTAGLTGGTLSTGAGLSRGGTGAITLGGSTSYTGVTAVNSGTLALGSTIASSGTTAGTVQISGGSPLLLGSGGTLNLPFSGSITLGPTSAAGTTISLGSGANSLSGVLNITGGTINFNTPVTIATGSTFTGGTVINHTGSPITIGGVTIPANGTVTLPGH